MIRLLKHVQILVILMALLYTSTSPLANAQQQNVPSISIQGHVDAHGNVVYNTELAGVITLNANPSIDTLEPDGFTYSNKAFDCKFVQAKGERLAAYTSESGGRSVDTMPVVDGKNEVLYPVLASLKCSDGVFRTVLPAELKAKVNIKAGHIVHLGGYLIEAKRLIKVGDSIPVFVVAGTSVLSVETGDGGKPWFTAFKEDSKPKINRAAVLKAWRTEKDFAHQ